MKKITLKRAREIEKSKKPDTLLHYRYICTACTGRAVYAIAPYFFVNLVCQNCGQNSAYLRDNWVHLTHNEFSSVNSL